MLLYRSLPMATLIQKLKLMKRNGGFAIKTLFRQLAWKLPWFFIVE